MKPHMTHHLFSPCALLDESSPATGRRIKGRGLATLCGIGLAFGAAVAFTGPVHAQTNLLYNGDFELTTTNFYYDNLTFTDAFGVPGWEAFAVGDSSSWVQVSQNTNTFNWDLNLNGTDYSAPDPYLGLAGMKTAVSNRVAVTPGTGYYATVTYDNYYEPAGISYFIDWFDAGGTTLSSSGGPLDDPNGPGTFAPFTQRFAITGVAPVNATRAGVRFQSSDGAPTYPSGATADNLKFAISPVLAITRNGNNVIVSWKNGIGFILQQMSDLSGVPVWTDLGAQNPQTIAITPSNAFFRAIGP
jgi:hypothetical protein